MVIKLSQYCPYYPKICQSCGLIDLSKEEYLTKKKGNFDLVIPKNPFHGRNKAKFVISGTIEEPIIGLSDKELVECPLHMPAITEVALQLKSLIKLIKLVPYDIKNKKGELKYILIFSNPQNELILRFVLRSKEAITRIQKYTPEILEQFPQIEILSANIQPEHSAIIEGKEEIIFTQKSEYIVDLAKYSFIVGPQTFFQTNHEVAIKLFETAREWVLPYRPTQVLDLFCGIGTFSIFLSEVCQSIVGVEINPRSIEYAKKSQEENKIKNVNFIAQDSKDFLEKNQVTFDLIVVNPPRRGLDIKDRELINKISPKYLLYSSCNPETLKRDLESFPHYKINKQLAFDMFPMTEHLEVLTFLELIN